MSGVRVRLFVTGMQRSGTTFLDKLLSGHREVTVHSQPLPLLFSGVRGRFLEEIGRPSQYPLSDMVHDNHYPPERWAEFLSGLVVDAELQSQLVHVMSTFGGQYTRMDDPLAFLGDFEGASLSDFIKNYLGYTLLLVALALNLLGLLTVPLSQMAFILPITFVLVPLFSLVFLRERLSTRYWFGTLLITAGVVVSLK